MKLEHPGLVEMPADEYHAHPALGHSALIKLLRSPAHYLQYRSEPGKDTPAKAFGTAFHSAVLEPALFAAEYAVVDLSLLDGTLQSMDDYRTAAEALGIKPGKLRKDDLKVAIQMADDGQSFRFREDEYDRLYGDKQVLSPDDAEKIRTIQLNASAHLRANEMLRSPGDSEMSGFWTDQPTGVECKLRIDKLCMAGSIPWAMLDVKTTRDASSDGFAKACATYGYDVQAAYYTDGAKAILGLELPFYFLAVENEAPHAVALYRASPEMIEAGRKKVRAGLMLMQYCQSTGNWPSYQPNGEEELISLPAWANRQADDYDLEG